MIYLAIFPLIYLCEIAGAICHAKYENQKRISYILTFFPFLFMFLLIALRGPGTGPDTANYLDHTRQIGTLSLREISNTPVLMDLEPGYLYTVRLLFRLFRSAQATLIFMALIPCLCFWIIINELSPNPYLSTLVFYCAGFFTFALNGARQFVAISLCGLAYMFLIKKKYIATVIACILSTFFHASSPIGFVPIILITLLPIRRYMAAAFTVCAAISMLLVRPIMEFLFSFITKYQKFLNSTSHDSIKMIAILWALELMIGLYLLFFAMKSPEQNGPSKISRMDHHIFCSILFTVLYVGITFCSSFVWLAMRIGLYFEMGILFLFPIFTEHLRKHQNRIIYLLAVVAINVIFTFWMSRSAADPLYVYHFFFEH